MIRGGWSFVGLVWGTNLSAPSQSALSAQSRGVGALLGRLCKSRRSPPRCARALCTKRANRESSVAMVSGLPKMPTAAETASIVAMAPGNGGRLSRVVPFVGGANVTRGRSRSAGIRRTSFRAWPHEASTITSFEGVVPESTSASRGVEGGSVASARRPLLSASDGKSRNVPGSNSGVSSSTAPSPP
jgi:hypothetical protein